MTDTIQTLHLEAALESDGHVVVSDDRFQVYGDGSSLSSALQDYIASWMEYARLVRNGAQDNEHDRRTLEDLRKWGYGDRKVPIRPPDSTGPGHTRI